jgi:hypothetical protein
MSGVAVAIRARLGLAPWSLAERGYERTKSFAVSLLVPAFLLAIALALTGVVAGVLPLSILGLIAVASCMQGIWRLHRTASELAFDPDSGTLHWRSILGGGAISLQAPASIHRKVLWGSSVYVIKCKHQRRVHFSLTSTQPEVDVFFGALHAQHPEMNVRVLTRILP